MVKQFDYIILGAGIYGCYAASELGAKGYKVALVEVESEFFTRASYVNQARVHNGYHYPRSYSTAIKSAKYFDKFNKHFDFAINNSFKKIYAISAKYSLASGSQFQKFCEQTNVPCIEVNPEPYFKKGLVEGAYETLEYAFDAKIIAKHFVTKIEKHKNIEVFFNTFLENVENDGKEYCLTFKDGKKFKAKNVFNTTYASINQIIEKFGFKTFPIKYEICELILVKVNSLLQSVGLTVMDGPFFSVMPFGLNGDHSLTSVTFTPHTTSYEKLPRFSCQEQSDKCSTSQLANCDSCKVRPATAFQYMNQLASKYLSDNIEIKYNGSLFGIKPILKASEIDDSRPTCIQVFSEEPRFLSILSGKINTIYDMDEYLI